MKTSTKIFWGFWILFALVITGSMAAFAVTARSWVAPDGRQLRSIDSLTGPWQELPVSLDGNLRHAVFEGAFDVVWEPGETVRISVEAPSRIRDPFVMRRTTESEVVFTNRMTGRFSGLALRLKITSPQLEKVMAKKTLKLQLAGSPGERLSIVSRGGLWMDGEGETMNSLDVFADGLCVLNLVKLPVRDLTLQLNGQTMVNAHVTDSLSGSVHGDGHVTITGNPPRQRLGHHGKTVLRIE